MSKLAVATFAIAGMLSSSGAYAQQYAGQSATQWTPDAERCVTDVVGTFNALRVRGDDLGFHLGVANRGSGHWQGVQRLKGGQGQYLVVSQSSDAAGRGGIAFVQMASRNALEARFRSNRLSMVNIAQTTPPAAAP